LAEYVKEVKTGSSHWLKEQAGFPRFEGWQDGYGAFTVSESLLSKVYRYIERQEEHHRSVSFLEEFKVLVRVHGLPFDERYL
jgi:hypothetical protein